MRKPFTFKIPIGTFMYNIICKSIKLHYCKSIKRACVAAELSKCEILKIQTNSHQFGCVEIRNSGIMVY